MRFAAGDCAPRPGMVLRNCRSSGGAIGASSEGEAGRRGAWKTWEWIGEAATAVDWWGSEDGMGLWMGNWTWSGKGEEYGGGGHVEVGRGDGCGGKKWK